MKIEIIKKEDNPVAEFFSSNASTPETDSVWEKLCCTNFSWYRIAEEMRTYCQKKERERDEERKDAAWIADRLSGLELRTTEELARLEQERNEARAKIERQAERIRQLEGATNRAGGLRG